MDQSDAETGTGAVLGRVSRMQDERQEEAWGAAIESSALIYLHRLAGPSTESGGSRADAPTNWKLMETSRFHKKLNTLPTGMPSTRMSSGPNGPLGATTVVSQYAGDGSCCAAS